ncbi:cell wall protein [Streptomyces sp. NBC_01190]|uniref:cell wall protein n=1 Tax=Streptomyces sp. NBC_01190 TaxID=2903767 RepID=UPI003867397B|nr:cell wall protein [Streptomyces sp. NBC_01190]
MSVVRALGRCVAWTPSGQRLGRLPFAVPVPVPRPAGVLWLAWRRHRAVYRTVLVVAALAALWAVWEHHQLTAAVHDDVRTCRRMADVCRADPSGSVVSPSHEWGTVRLLFDQVPSVLRFLPLAVAALVGAPLFAQDMENGTHRLAWTQSVGRREWAAAKLATALTVTATAAIVLTGPVTWWWYTSWRGEHTGGLDGYVWRTTASWDDWSFFPYVGPAAVAHLLLALMIGAATGMLLRRTLAAVAVAAIVSEGAQLALAAARPHLLATHVQRGTGLHFPVPPMDSWYLDGGLVRTDGSLTDSYPSCAPRVGFDACLQTHGLVGQYSRSLHIDELPLLQLVETGICLAAAAALIAFCLWYVPRIAAR